MDKFKKIKKCNFTQISNEMLRNPALSAQAKGILCFFMQLPEEWQIHIRELTKHFNNGETSIRSAISELVENGYIRTTRQRNDRGVFENTLWEYSDTPLFKGGGATSHSNPHRGFPHVDIPHVDSPDVDIPHVENRTVYNTEKLNTEYGVNTESIYPPNPPRGDSGNFGNFPVSHGSFSENPNGSFEGQRADGIQVSDGNPYGSQGSSTAMSARHDNADLEGLNLEWVNPSPVSTPEDVEKRKSSAKKKKDFAPVQGSLFGEPINNTTPSVKVAEKAEKGANNAKAYETAREFVRLWNEMAVQNGYPKVTALTDGRIRAVSRAIKSIKAECGSDSVDITALFGKIAKSDYLKANARNRQKGNGTGMWFDFDWVVEPPKQGEPISNAVKIWLGRFDNAPMVQQTAPTAQNGANAPKNRKLGGLDLMAEAMRIAERIDNGEIPQMLSDMGCDIYNTQTAPTAQNGANAPHP